MTEVEEPRQVTGDECTPRELAERAERQRVAHGVAHQRPLVVERAELTADGDWDVAVLHMRSGEQLELYSEAPRGRREHLAEVFAQLFGDRLGVRRG